MLMTDRGRATEGLLITWASWLVLCGLLALPGCQDQDDAGSGPAPRDMEALPPIIAAVSASPMPTSGPIVVRFTEPLIDEASVGAVLSASPFTFIPELRGDAVWRDRRTLEFRPATPLAAGQHVAVSLDLEALGAAETGPPTCTFTVTTEPRRFELTLGALESEGADAASLVGVVAVNADVADRDLEEALQVELPGARLEVHWVHDLDGGRRGFIITGIERDDEPRTLNVVLDGRRLGVDREDRRQVVVPARGRFALQSARSVESPDRCIELRFTDPLVAGQDLRGLIEVLGRDDVSVTVDGAVARLFAQGTWQRTEVVRIAQAVRGEGAGGQQRQLAADVQVEVAFAGLPPAVRWVGDGVIVPSSLDRTVPIETANLRAVTVRVMHLQAGNVAQFLQVNSLEGEYELHRVGREVWQAVIDLPWSDAHADRWVRTGLDLSPVIAANPGGLYRLELSFEADHVTVPCEEWTHLARFRAEGSGGDILSWLAARGEHDWGSLYARRLDPCHGGYYDDWYDHDITVRRNVLLSDVGLLARRGPVGPLLLTASDLRTAAPLSGARVTVLDFQRTVLSTGRTGADGTASLDLAGEPDLAVVEHDRGVGYLRLGPGAARSLTHFDVGGQPLQDGLKGFLYGERGVWRPGDTIYLSFILDDQDGSLPADHPLTFTLTDSRGQTVAREVRREITDGFAVFAVTTRQDAPTGSYTARVQVGGAVFTQPVRVETIMPNRLEVDLAVDADVISGLHPAVPVRLSARWLHGAPARDLNADVELRLQADRDGFAAHPGYVFDDPTRRVPDGGEQVFAGRLDAEGATTFTLETHLAGTVPGRLVGDLRVRVFEPGGAFSTEHASAAFSPFERYVGLRPPAGDPRRGVLSTGEHHDLDILVVDQQGEPVPAGRVELRLLRLDWRWWWQQGDDDLARYAAAEAVTPVAVDTLALSAGQATWDLHVDGRDWGRYLILAEDLDGGHRAGVVALFDWPGWGSPPGGDRDGASVLTLATDRTEYQVGDQVELTIPAGGDGRCLVSLESGDRVVHSEWLTGEAPLRYRFTATKDMVPGVYAHVTYLQPHAQTRNDLPLRLYGVAPIAVTDPASRLQPVLTVPASYRSEAPAAVTVHEAQGRPMTYTLALVDVGLLNLTGFQTPDPWQHFHQREALGVRTWDLYDDVLGASAGVLEALLAIGGGAGAAAGQQAALEPPEARRFPPLVRFFGPFRLASGERRDHRFDLPQYLGAVRVMVVAGRHGAYGSAEARVPVRAPLMAQATLPRVLSVGERVDLPVTVFAMADQVREAVVSVEVDGPLTVEGPGQQTVAFDRPGEAQLAFTLAVGEAPGRSRVVVTARGAGEQVRQTIDIEVRVPSQRVVQARGATLAAGERWQADMAMPGLPGTGTVVLELSRIAAMDLDRRLAELTSYPHGCVEQLTSAAFPQLYLPELVDLDAADLARVQRNVTAAIARLPGYQSGDGGVALWPGNREADPWSTSYAGHFLIEADRRGYAVSGDLRARWLNHQRNQARRFSHDDDWRLRDQAYRLFTLALARSPEIGAMNRLRERTLPVIARWQLAAAYQLSGHQDAARELIAGLDVRVPERRGGDPTYGSTLRDQALLLEALLVLDRQDMAMPLARTIAEQLRSDRWLSTQTAAVALRAMAQVAASEGSDGKLSCRVSWNDGPPLELTSDRAVLLHELPVADGRPQSLVLENLAGGTLFARVITSGLPAPGGEVAAAAGLDLAVEYQGLDGAALDPSSLVQGTDLRAVITVSSRSALALSDLALTYVAPAGWEIISGRLGQDDDAAGAFDHRDTRDDRMHVYFGLGPAEQRTVTVLLNAAYVGRYYLPLAQVEAMYDATVHARVPGRWVEVRRREGS